MVFKNFLAKAKDIDILAGLPDGVLLVNADGKIEWANDASAEILTTSKLEILKLRINDIIDGGFDLARQAVESSKAVVGRAKNPIISDFYVEITARVVENYLIVCFRDVTKNYKTVTNIMVEHESSKKNNKDKNVFLAKLSNELKSPLQSVIGFSQAMIDGLGGSMSDKQEKYIKIINKNSNEILYLIDKIIELSKIESNLVEYDYQIFEVSNTIQTALKLYEQNIKDKGLSLNFDNSELSKRTIFSDENAFKNIFQNILESSVNSTDIGSINIKLFHPEMDTISQKMFEVPEGASEKSYLQLCISDTGAGIADSDLSVIFEPYVQLDKPNKKNIVRSIALATARNYARVLKGAIWVESEPMQGSTYNVIIPIEKLK